MKTYTADELKEILRKHALWLQDEGGERADLFEANLFEADLAQADLRWANLSEANLSEAYLSGANLTGANLTEANLTEANLFGADLSEANLSEAYLSEAYLFNTIGNGKEIKHFKKEGYHFAYTVERLQIGCRQHPIDAWRDFSMEEIEEMGTGAGELWVENKELIRSIIENNPAEPTGRKNP